MTLSSSDEEYIAPPIELSERAFAAYNFVRSESMARSTGTDRWRRGSPVKLVTVAVVTVWPEVDRAIRAIQAVDREIRRCARAWTDARQQVPEVEDSANAASASTFLKCLKQYPQPVAVGRGSLRIRATSGPPLGILLEPTREVLEVLEEWPISCTAYAMSAFGVPAWITLHHACQLSGALANDEQQRLSSLTEAAAGYWNGPDTEEGFREDWEIKDLRSSLFRTIAESFDTEAGHRLAGIDVVVHRLLANGSEDLVRARVC